MTSYSQNSEVLRSFGNERVNLLSRMPFPKKHKTSEFLNYISKNLKLGLFYVIMC